MSTHSPDSSQAAPDSLSAHIAILNSVGTIVSVNAAWRRFALGNGFGGDSNYGVGANYLAICESATGTDAEEAPAVLRGIREVLGGQSDEFYLEYPCHAPTSERWFSLRATRFVSGENNGDVSVVVSHENVSSQKSVELRLRDEIEITETLYHVGQVVAGELDLNEVIRVVTEAAVELCEAGLGCFVPAPGSDLGWPLALSAGSDGFDEDGILDLIEREFEAILPLSPDAGDDTHDLRAQLEMFRVGSSLAVPVVTRDGQRLGALFLASHGSEAFGAAGERIAAALASQAALALENARLYERARREQIAAAQSEKRYRFVTDMMPQIVWTTRPDGHHDYFNQRWYEFTGQTEPQSLGGGWMPLHPDDVERSKRRWQHSLETGELYEIEYRLRRFDGVYRWFLARAAPLRDEAGQVLRWFGTCTDIDEQKQAEVERVAALEREERARREAETANRLKDDFLAVVSHELRTPLTPILGWVEMLRDDDADAPFRAQAYDVIERNARAQSQIVNDLLDVSRITSGKMRLDLQPLDLRDVLFAAIQTCEGAARGKGVEIVREFPDEPLSFVGDADRLQQVAWNLISNAIKFTPRGGRISLRLQRHESAIQLEIADTGAGLEPDFLPFVFERFRQADASSTRRFGGLGLGLSIVKHLVEQHGGEVSVHSEGKNLGSTFGVRLPVAPLVPLEDEGVLSGETQPKTPRAKHDALSGLQILVVDDEADAREVLAQMLRRFGAIVETAASAAFALERLGAHTPDILISDIGMPGGDGYSLLQSLRELPSERGHVPALALTAYARAEDKTRALENGFGAYLAKPVAPDQLVAALKMLAKRD